MDVITDIYELLALIKQRPAMWFGEHQLSALRAFLNGYSYGQGRYGYDDREMPPFGLLNDWIAIKYNQGRTTAGWCHILTKECQGDGEAALDLFFEVLEEYKRIRPVRIVEISLSSENQASWDALDYWFTIGGAATEWKRRPAPDTVYIVHFSGGLGYYVVHHIQGKRVHQDCYYLSLRAALKQLRQQFGPTLARKELLDFSASAIASIMGYQPDASTDSQE